MQLLLSTLILFFRIVLYQKVYGTYVPHITRCLSCLLCPALLAHFSLRYALKVSPRVCLSPAGNHHLWGATEQISPALDPSSFFPCSNALSIVILDGICFQPCIICVYSLSHILLKRYILNDSIILLILYSFRRQDREVWVQVDSILLHEPQSPKYYLKPFKPNTSMITLSDPPK